MVRLWKVLCPKLQGKRNEFWKEEGCYMKGVPEGAELCLWIVNVWLCVLTEAQKMKPNITNCVYNSNCFPRTFPFFTQHPTESSSPLSETIVECILYCSVTFLLVSHMTLP